MANHKERSKFNSNSSRPNPDDRSDNYQKINENIQNTEMNIELAEEMIGKTSNLQNKVELQAKNERRKASIEGMKRELEDEKDFSNN